jgi:hypothetical protein
MELHSFSIARNPDQLFNGQGLTVKHDRHLYLAEFVFPIEMGMRGVPAPRFLGKYWILNPGQARESMKQATVKIQQ